MIASFTLPEALLAAQGTGKTVVFIDNLGAMDTLAAIQPIRDSVLGRHNDDYLTRVRPNLLTPDQLLVRLSSVSDYGLHPGLRDLEPLWRRGDFGILMNAGFERTQGSNQNLRSHFEQMRNIQLGSPNGTLRDGVFNRVLGVLPSNQSAYQGIAIQGSLPVSLTGQRKATAVTDLAGLGLGDRTYRGTFGDFMGSLASLYRNAHQAYGGGLLNELATSTGGLIQEGQSLRRTGTVGNYDMRNAFHRNLRTAADLIVQGKGKSTVIHVPGLTGLDTHNIQVQAPTGGENSKARKGHIGPLASTLESFGTGVRAFMDDIQSAGKAGDVIVIAMSEFSRTIRQNGNYGSDHGGGTTIYLFGKPVAKQKLKHLAVPLEEQNEGEAYRDPGVGADGATRGSDLFQAFDYRRVLAEVFVKHLGVPASQIATIFPGLNNPASYYGMLG